LKENSMILKMENMFAQTAMISTAQRQLKIDSIY
jgi:hypothetical protein